MIALNLQESLKNEIEKKILKDVLLHTQTGTDREISVYKQSLPVQHRNEDEEALFPYLLIRLDSGDFKLDDNRVRVLLLFGIYNSDNEKQGHIEVMNCIDKVYQRFANNNLLEGKYRANDNMNWQLQEDDTYPLYFGGMELEFEIPSIRRENEFI